MAYEDDLGPSDFEAPVYSQDDLGPSNFGTGSDGSFWETLKQTLSGLDPKLLSGLLGAVGPTAGLIGSLAGGGQGPTTSGTQSSNQTGSNTGSRQNQSNENTTRNGYDNRTTQSTLDPVAQQAMDRLNSMIQGDTEGAQGAYNQGLSMLQQLATGKMGQIGGGGSAVAGPNTTPSPAAVTGFPTELPTSYNAGLGNLIKQVSQGFISDLGDRAAGDANSRGFYGGKGDLLGNAAAPMMGRALAQVPGMEAKAYMDHVLQAYDLQSQNAGRKAGAESGALNAATNALGPGVSKYGMDVSKYAADRNADNNEISQITSLLQALMGPKTNLMNANLGLLNNAPRGSTTNTLTGDTANRSLSGSESSLSNSTDNRTGANTGTSQTPMGPAIAQGVGNIAQGAATGIANQEARDAAVAQREAAAAQQAAQNRQNQTFMDLLARRA